MKGLIYCSKNNAFIALFILLLHFGSNFEDFFSLLSCVSCLKLIFCLLICSENLMKESIESTNSVERGTGRWSNGRGSHLP